MYRYPFYRNSPLPPKLPPPPPKLPSPCSAKPPLKKKKKFDFIEFKKDTYNSLNDVEHFLCDFNCFLKYVKLYKLLKK